MEQRQIKEIRGSMGLSQERFAQLLGVSLQTVWRWESGLTKPLPVIESKLQELQQETSTSRRRRVSSIPRSGIPPRGAIPARAREQRSGGAVEGGLGGLFKGFGSLLDLMSGIADEGSEETSRTGRSEARESSFKGVWGFSIRIGAGGRPVVDRFGNIHDTEAGTVVTEDREPLVDVMEEGNQVAVIAELPGVAEQDIQVRIWGEVLEISGEGKDRRYRKEILLPSPIDPDTLGSSYRNGVLEVRMAMRQPGANPGGSR